MSKASEQTKLVLAQTLRELLQEKRFSKISISDIAYRAGVNRKTFYYHFRSTDALLAWMIESETFDTVKEVNILSNNLIDTINFALDYLEQNQELLRSVNSAIGRSSVHKFLYHNLYPVILSVLGQIDEDKSLEPGFKDFIAEFYTEAVAGVLQNWIEKPILRDRNEITEYILRLVEDAKRHLASN